MNAVILAVLIMLGLSLFRIHVVIALVIGAIAGGLLGGLSLNDTIEAFSSGLGGGATVALSYALLGSFAVGLTRTGLPELIVERALKMVNRRGGDRKKGLAKVLILFVILLISCFSQNLVPVHIAFIPILIPPILQVLNELGMDRRAVAAVLTFGLTAPYILLPAGFGKIFHEILQSNMADSGMEIELSSIPTAMLLPTAGLVVGLLIAVFISYRKPRAYKQLSIAQEDTSETYSYSNRSILFAILSVVVTLAVQIPTESMILGALSGIIVLYITGSIRLAESEAILTDGMKMMAFIGFVMLAANGFAEVLRQTGEVQSLVTQASGLIGDNKALAALLMLIVGLFITMGIGSSFSTIPIIAAIYVPLAMELGFSPMATIALVGTAAALGDAGSPASDSTLGPTSGLNADGQHNHIWDTVVPTFLHYNIPLILFGWIAAMIF
ncbi:Na+/H+ antiporter family protein [Alkalihalobacillus hwajinpoensis]|uniref:Na+/H+ antiporter family protein n=1 Tax=Guptibacillus hwajinpoensis TaxID=208199 RepID=UPI0018846891|nr:Na+/H+ antiporter family protein [Pseudalkalibacillus hwajinpoensis]MBF0705956.1 Na+/H+ antiporter family protein [Pseudalkalibacillus hwajinpoensis]